MNKLITKEVIIDMLAESLDITPTQHQEALKRFNNIKSYLENNINNAKIYLQGSFALGTTIRPIKRMEERDFDIDIVCQLPQNITDLSKIKNTVGDVLKSSVYNRFLDKEEGKRCWTLNYKENSEEGFHIDILPSVPEDPNKVVQLKTKCTFPNLINSAIMITNKTDENNYIPKTSNPLGLITWFNNVSKESFKDISWPVAKANVFEKNKAFFTENLNISAMSREIENYVRTPLQRVIQILKRHRDIMFSDDKHNEDYKPISAIITILTTKIAEENIDKYDSTYSLLNIVLNTISEYSKLNHDGVDSNFLQFEKEKRLIEKRENLKGWFIENPTNPEENLADRWHENSNARANAFFEWIEKVKSDLSQLVNDLDTEKMKPLISYNFGKETSEKVYSLCDRFIAENYKSDTISPTKPWRYNA